MKSECLKCDYCGHIFRQGELVTNFGEKDSCELCKPFAWKLHLQMILEYSNKRCSNE